MKLPSGGDPVTHFKKKRSKTPHCNICGRIIFGVASKINGLSLSEKRPQRMFGGQLCHTCLLNSLKSATRGALQA